ISSVWERRRRRWTTGRVESSAEQRPTRESQAPVSSRAHRPYEDQRDTCRAWDAFQVRSVAEGSLELPRPRARASEARASAIPPPGASCDRPALNVDHFTPSDARGGGDVRVVSSRVPRFRGESTPWKAEGPP